MSLVSTIFSYKEMATSDVWKMAFQSQPTALLQSKRKITFEEEALKKMSHKLVRIYPETIEQGRQCRILGLLGQVCAST